MRAIRPSGSGAISRVGAGVRPGIYLGIRLGIYLGVGLGFLCPAVSSLAGAAVTPPGKVHRHDPDALWHIVGEGCAKSGSPCAVYDPARGFALLHSVEGRGQYLLIPTVRRAGMESAALLLPETPNYLALAWAYRARVGHDYGRFIDPRMLSLAINSVGGRSQNQLHIHLDCLDPAIRDALDRAADRIGPRWRVLTETLHGHRYRAMYLATLNGSPFRILAADMAHPESEMGAHTLVLAPLGAGYVLLDDVAKDGDRASGEELQDHTCRVLTDAP